MCGAKSGNKVYSALWVYNCLLQCRTVAQLEREKEKTFPLMHRTDLRYLNSLSDESQYPAARRTKAPGVYMYHRTLLAAVESMNAAKRHASKDGSRSIERMHSINQNGVQTVHKSTEIGMGNGN